MPYRASDYNPAFTGPVNPGEDLNDLQLEQLLGLQAPQLDRTQEQPYRQNGVGRFLEGLSGLEDAPTSRPTNFWEGLVSGTSRGLGNAGTRIAAAHEKYDAMARSRQAARDQANLDATKTYRQEKSRRLYEYGKEQRTTAEKATKAATETAEKATKTAEQTPGTPEYAAMLRREGDVARVKAAGSATGNPRATGGASNTDVGLLADAIEQGNQPPDTKGFYRLAGPVKAELQKRGYDFTTANKDWQATQRNIATLNGPQQTRLRQAAETAYHSLDIIDELSDKLQAMAPQFKGTVPEINRASLAILKRLPGEPGSVARQLEAEISDVTSEIGNVYMGGNSPTDHSLTLAAKNLSGNWSYKQLRDATALARRNLAIRRNSIGNSTPMVPGGAPAADTRPPASTFWKP